MNHTKAQNNSYMNQLEVDADRCQHESDGSIWKAFGNQYESFDCSIPYNKCKKCGEFYTCLHESGVALYAAGVSSSIDEPDPVIFKCNRCGEFYK